MRRSAVPAFFCCLVLAVPLAVRAETAAAVVRLVDVADGVWAALQPHEGRFDDANVVVVEGTRATLVIDAPSSSEAIAAVVAEIRRRHKAPVRYVLNTHWHADHTQGNALYREAFGDGVLFIGHDTLRREIPERAAHDHAERVARYEGMIPEAEAQLAKGLGLKGQTLTAEQREQQRTAIEQARVWLAANRGLEFVVPQMTYASRLDLDLGGIDVHLLHERAHTSGDTVVWIPARAVLVTGDVIDDLPYIGHGHPRSWIDALAELRALPFEKIVPGHGPVFEDREPLDRVDGFLRALVAHADGAAAAGVSAEAAVKSFDAAPWRRRMAAEDPAAQRFFDAVLAEAVGRAMEETVPE